MQPVPHEAAAGRPDRRISGCSSTVCHCLCACVRRCLQRLLLTLGVGLTDLSRTRDDGGYSFLAPEVTLLDDFDDDDEIPLKRLREIDAVVADRHGYVLSKRGAEVIVVYSGRAGIPARVMTLHKDVCRIKPVSIDIGGKINTERHSVFLSVGTQIAARGFACAQKASSRTCALAWLVCSTKLEDLPLKEGFGAHARVWA